MRKENGESIESANVPQMIFSIQCDTKLKAGDILIKSKKQIQLNADGF